MPGWLKWMQQTVSRGRTRSLSYPMYGYAGGNGGGYYGTGGSIFSRLLPGADFNYVIEALPYYKNAIIAGCLKQSLPRFSQPILVIERKVGDGRKKELVTEHPVLEIFEEPNQDGDDLAAMCANWKFDRDLYGDDKWFILRNGMRQPVGFQHIPYGMCVTMPDTDPTRLVGGYRYFVNGAWTDFDRAQVLHWKAVRNPENIREGMSFVLPGSKEICGYNELTTTIAATARNMGIVPYLVSPKMTATQQEEDIMPVDVAEWIKKALGKTRDERGLNAVSRTAVDVNKIGLSPQELMSLDAMKMLASVLCPLLGMDPMLPGLPSESKTFANYEECQLNYLENNVMPEGAAMLSQLNRLFRASRQLAPDEVLAWDYRHIPGYADAQDQKADEANEAWKSGRLKLSECRAITGDEMLPGEPDGYIWQLVPGYQIKGAVIPGDKSKASADEDGSDASGDGGKSYRVPVALNGNGRKAKDERWVTIHGHAVNLDDPPEWMGAGGAMPAAAPTARTKSEIAKGSAYRVDSDIQRYSEEHNEPVLAKAIGGLSLRDNEPVDVLVIEKGVVKHGVELKTVVSNKAGKITMSKSAVARKAAWMETHGAPFHTVVFDDSKAFNADGAGKHDDSKRQIYYKRGFGSFRLSSMEKVTDLPHLNTLMSTSDDKLPKGAQPPAGYKSPEKTAVTA